MQLSELDALRAYATVLNTLNPEALGVLESLLAEDFVYESQMVLTPLRSKREFFRAIGEACGKPVVIAHFVPFDDMHSMSNGRK